MQTLQVLNAKPDKREKVRFMLSQIVSKVYFPDLGYMAFSRFIRRVLLLIKEQPPLVIFVGLGTTALGTISDSCPNEGYFRKDIWRHTVGVMKTVQTKAKELLSLLSSSSPNYTNGIAINCLMNGAIISPPPNDFEDDGIAPATVLYASCHLTIMLLISGAGMLVL